MINKKIDKHIAFLLSEAHDFVECVDTTDTSLYSDKKHILSIIKTHAFTVDDCFVITEALSEMTKYLREQSFINIYNKKDDGWKLLKRSCLYKYYALRLELKNESRILQQKYDNPLTMVKGIAPCALLCFILNMPESFYLFETLSLSTRKTLFWLDDDYLGLFAVELYRILINSSQKKNHSDSPLPYDLQYSSDLYYDQILSHWNRSEELTHNIHSLCQYYYKMYGSDQWEKGPYPFSCLLYPYVLEDISAVLQTRQILGIPTVPLNHPMLHTPFFPIPEFIKNYTTEDIFNEDPFIQEVAEHCEQFLSKCFLKYEHDIIKGLKNKYLVAEKIYGTASASLFQFPAMKTKAPLSKLDYLELPISMTIHDKSVVLRGKDEIEEIDSTFLTSDKTSLYSAYSFNFKDFQKFLGSHDLQLLENISFNRKCHNRKDILDCIRKLIVGNIPDTNCPIWTV